MKVSEIIENIKSVQNGENKIFFIKKQKNEKHFFVLFYKKRSKKYFISKSNKTIEWHKKINLKKAKQFCDVKSILSKSSYGDFKFDENLLSAGLPFYPKVLNNTRTFLSLKNKTIYNRKFYVSDVLNKDYFFIEDGKFIELNFEELGDYL